MRHAGIAVTMMAAFAIVSPAHALECPPPVSVSIELQKSQADVVLLGRIAAVQRRPTIREPGEYLLVTVDVEQLWKGSTPERIQLHQLPVGFMAVECFSKPASKVNLSELGPSSPPQ